MANDNDNAMALAAWDDWKSTCSINACTKDKKEILQKLIYSAVFGNSVKTGHLEKMGLPMTAIGSIHARLKGTNNNEEENLANVFDAYIKLAEYPDAAMIVKPKAWKNFVWCKVNDPSNNYPKLQTIHAYLINNGEGNWYKCALFYVISNYLGNEFCGRIEQLQNPVTGKKYYKVVWDESLTEKDDETGESKQKDIVDELLQEDESGMTDEDFQELKDNYDDALTDQDCIFILAALLEIPLYKSQTLMRSLNKESSRMYDLRNEALAKLKAVELPREFIKLTSERQNDFFLDYLYERLKVNMPGCLKICCQEALPIFKEKLEKLNRKLSSLKKEETKDRVQHQIFDCEAIIRKLEGGIQ